MRPISSIATTSPDYRGPTTTWSTPSGPRHHERRATGRKTGDSGFVLRGQVRLLASVVGQCRVMDAADLMPTDLLAWQAMRQELNFRAEARRAQHRFRHNPAAYLATLETLETQLLQSGLPP